MVEVRVNGVIHYAEPGTLLGDLLAGEHSGEAHFEGCAGSGGKLPGSPMLALPCGGHGRCGKCRVFARGALSPLSDAERRLLSREDIDRGIRLACCTAVEGDCSVEMELLPSC